MTTIQGHRVLLRTYTAADQPRAREILSTPEVSKWWGDPDTEAEGLLDEGDGTTSYVIELEGVVVGIVQSSEELTPQYRHAGIDIAVHPDWHGQGVGTDAIYTLARHLIEAGHHRLTTDPAVSNEAAVRCYGKLGFRPVGLMRQYERGQDGTWHDGLLMDLLAHELVQPSW